MDIAPKLRTQEEKKKKKKRNFTCCLIDRFEHNRRHSHFKRSKKEKDLKTLKTQLFVNSFRPTVVKRPAEKKYFIMGSYSGAVELFGNRQPHSMK